MRAHAACPKPSGLESTFLLILGTATSICCRVACVCGSVGSIRAPVGEETAGSVTVMTRHHGRKAAGTRELFQFRPLTVANSKHLGE